MGRAMKTDPQSAYFTAFEKWMSPAGQPALPAWVIWAIAGNPHYSLRSEYGLRSGL